MSEAVAHSNKDRRLRVLVIAEAANPEWVSVPLVGWSLAEALGQVCDVHVVTQVRNRDAFLRAGKVEGVDFTAIDSEAVAAFSGRIARTLRMGEGKGWTIATALSSKLSYPYFERLVWKQFGDQIKAGAFDIVHRVTPLTPTASSSIAPKCASAGVPFVLGPLNGGVPWPKGFDRERRREKEWLSYVRGAYKFSNARRRMLNVASAIIAGSRFTASDIPARHRKKVALIPENAIDPGRFSQTNEAKVRGGTLPLRGCFLGRLVPYKGPDMLLEAAEPLLRNGSLVLDIVGSGPLEKELISFTKERGLEDTVTFHGWVPHNEVQNILAEADMLTFPSVREFGGGVVLEAMTLGVVPVICDYAGPSELVDDSTGFKVAMGTRDDVVNGFRSMLREIVSEPSVLKNKSKAARGKVASTYTWARKANQVKEIYDWVLQGNGPMPAPISFEEPLWAK